MTMFDAAAKPPMTTSIGNSTPDDIWVQGFNLAEELMGQVDFGSMSFLLISGRLPSPGEAAVFNAILVALADHGLTPSALASRLTYTGAPEALQGAIASGVLGAGSVYLGVFEDTGRMLQQAAPTDAATDADLQQLCTDIINSHRQSGQKMPGLGHPFHKNGDPRTTRLLKLAQEHDLIGPHTRLMLMLHEQARSSSGARLPINAPGISGALLSDMGFDARILRGIAVISRAAGVVGHVAEEIHAPLGETLWYLAERQTTYQPRR
jgi:citrate synthase